MLKILLLDDSLERSEFALTLVQHGHIVAVASTLQNVWEKLTHFEFDWICCHRNQTGGLVDAFVQAMLEPDADAIPTRVLLLTSPPAPRNLSRMPVAQIEVLERPFSPERILSVLEAPLPGPKVPTAIAAHLAEPTGHQLAPGVPPFIGNCSQIQKVIRQVEKVAGTDATILLLGESGTGKELIAQSIHFRSHRAHKPLIPINCGAIPSDLLESELFGHVKGAFTGAHATRLGRFAMADGGTLFLDEVAELPLNLQVKLLRALQDLEITPLGSSKAQKVDVRIIAATNQVLEQLVEKKLFREDLYYRLNVIPIHLPALRERILDIAELINYFVVHFNERLGSNLKGFTAEAMEALLNYPWPGNIRELKNFVERLAILNDGDVVTLRDMPEKIQRYKSEHTKPIDVTLPEQGLNFYEAVEQFEKALIIQALDRTDWNKNKAAALLTMNRTTLVEKIKKKEISRG